MTRIEAGVKAEKQMAFYLNRYFSDREQFLVLHNIRLERKGEIAQIDHMVIHNFGIAIIESKSVSVAVRVNTHNEWERRHNNQWKGMPSPVAQAKRQGRLLHYLLADHAHEILGNLVFNIPQGVGAMGLDVFVAISDTGRIIRQEPHLAPEASKADLIPEKIHQLAKHYAKPTQFLNPKTPRTFNDRERAAIAAFLNSRNTPPGRQAAPAAIDAFENSTPALLRCPKCNGTRMIDWNRKASYHFKCTACADTQTIKVICPKCTTTARISKSGNDYSIHCKDCNMKVPYCTVPSGP